MNNEELKKAFDFEIEHTNEPLYSDKVLKFIKNYHKKTKPEKDKFINSYQNNVLEIISEIDFAFNDLIKEYSEVENYLYKTAELTPENNKKRLKLIKEIETLKSSKLQWSKDLKRHLNITQHFPDFFKNEKAFMLFLKFIENDIADALSDFSFIFQSLKSDKHIHDIKQKTFYNWLFDSKYINQKDYDKINQNGGLKAYNKCNSEKRLNKYLRLKEQLFSSDFQ